MTKDEAISLLTQINKILVNSNSWLESTHNPINTSFGMAIKALKQEPKTGHWILDETDNSITCNKCGCLIWANDISDGEAYYCPNCGAKMMEKEE